MLQSDNDEDPTEESSLRTEADGSPEAVPGCSTSEPSASCSGRADSQDNLQENGQNDEAEEIVLEPETSEHRGGFQVATGTVPPAASKPHLFIFDRESQDMESQDMESQSIFAERPAAPARLQEVSNTGPAHSLSQLQLEEDRQRIRKLVEETKQVSTQWWWVGGEVDGEPLQASSSR